MDLNHTDLKYPNDIQLVQNQYQQIRMDIYTMAHNYFQYNLLMDDIHLVWNKMILLLHVYMFDHPLGIHLDKYHSDMTPTKTRDFIY